MNKKGQALVAFILFLPVLILFISMIYDFGLLGLEKKKASNNIKDAITYGLKNKDKENITDDIDNLLVNNIKNIRTKDIVVNTDTIDIAVTIKVDGNFNHLFDKNLYIIKLKYRGYIENDKIKIKEW